MRAARRRTAPRARRRAPSRGRCRPTAARCAPLAALIRAHTITPVSPMPPSVASNSSVAGPELQHLPGRGQQPERQHMAAERARGAVVLAVDVAGDRAADGHVLGTRHDRHDPARAGSAARAARRVSRPPAPGHVPRSASSSIALEPGGVEHEAAAQLGRVAVAAPHPAGDRAGRDRAPPMRATAAPGRADPLGAQRAPPARPRSPAPAVRPRRHGRKRRRRRGPGPARYAPPQPAA